MTHPEPIIYPHDDIGGTLNVPAGAEHVPRMEAPHVEASMPNVAVAPALATPEPAGLVMKLAVGSALAACVGLGAILLMRMS